ncbi:hypothetical protein JCM33374_g3585 [Metschnikowia sp. JCM 33374]|nr:hypothetical protein JCM33374_g3585 [Metschnikowia sp. JCM 33374]
MKSSNEAEPAKDAQVHEKWCYQDNHKVSQWKSRLLKISAKSKSSSRASSDCCIKYSNEAVPACWPTTTSFPHSLSQSPTQALIEFTSPAQKKSMKSSSISVGNNDYDLAVHTSSTLSEKSPILVYITQRGHTNIGSYVYTIGRGKETFSSVLQQDEDVSVQDLATNLGRVISRKFGCPGGKSFSFNETCVKSFISDSHFDGVRLKASAHNLQRTLSSILHILRSTRPQIYTNKPLFYQYIHVFFMFEGAMVEASDALEYYSSMDNTEGYLTRRMIETNIGALFNSHGVLDVKASENIDRIIVYWNLIQHGDIVSKAYSVNRKTTGYFFSPRPVKSRQQSGVMGTGRDERSPGNL